METSTLPLLFFALSCVSDATVVLKIADNKFAEEGSSIILVCTVSSLTSAVTIFNPCSITEGSCSAPLRGGRGVCNNLNVLQNVFAGTTKLVIPSFSINSHHGCWKCTHGIDARSLCVQGYIIPSQLTLTVSSSGRRTFMINTDCAFPVVKMKWQLVNAPDASGEVVEELGQHNCTPIDDGTCATFTGCTVVAQNALKYSCSYNVPNSVAGVKGKYYLRGSVVLSGQYGSLLTTSNQTFTTEYLPKDSKHKRKQLNSVPWTLVCISLTLLLPDLIFSVIYFIGWKNSDKIRGDWKLCIVIILCHVVGYILTGVFAAVISKDKAAEIGIGIAIGILAAGPSFGMKVQYLCNKNDYKRADTKKENREEHTEPLK